MTSEGGNWNLLPLYLDSVVYPDWHPRFGEVGPVYAFLLESDEYLVLVDTGIGPEQPLIDRLYQPTRRDLPAALAQNNTSIFLAAISFNTAFLSCTNLLSLGANAKVVSASVFAQSNSWCSCSCGLPSASTATKSTINGECGSATECSVPPQLVTVSDNSSTSSLLAAAR